jgi:hypothetical protein
MNDNLTAIIIDAAVPSLLLRVGRYGAQVLRAFKGVQMWRLKHFVKGFDDVAQELSPEDRARFESFKNLSCPPDVKVHTARTDENCGRSWTTCKSRLNAPCLDALGRGRCGYRLT